MSISKRKLKNGSFAFQATDRTPHFPSISKTLVTRREAREWLAAVRSEWRRGLAFDPKQNASMSLGEAMQKYADVVSAKKQGAGQELSMARRWLRHPFANRPIGEILPFEFDEYVDARLAKGVTASTLLKELSFALAFYCE